MTTEETQIFEELAAVRKRTIGLYVRLAALTDAEAVGFKPRDPDAPDMTLELIRRAWESDQAQARAILKEIVANDIRIDDLLVQIIDPA